MTAHPLSWFVERVGKEIIRVHPKRGGFITVEDDAHATYLFDVQCECGYRYDDAPKERKG